MFALKWGKFRYSSLQFGVWRALFGLLLTLHFIELLPYGEELFSDGGPYKKLSLFASGETFFPTFFLQFDSPAQVHLILLSCIGLSLLIMLGCGRRISAFLLWICEAWLHNRNIFHHPPEIAFINWLIFALIFIPTGERFSLSRKNPKWQMPPSFYWGAWIVLAAGYCYAGYFKAISVDHGWLRGEAMYYVLTREFERLSWYGNFFDHFPMLFFRILSWSALIMETFSFIFIFFKKIRPWWWLTATLAHCFLLFFLSLTEVHLGMILYHLFLFNLKWVEGSALSRGLYHRSSVLLSRFFSTLASFSTNLFK